MKVLFTITGLLLAASCARVWAANGGDQVVVVYNNRVKESKAVAEYYALRRQVPAAQVFGLDLPESEDITRAEFRDSFQKPLAAGLDRAKLWRIASVMIPATTNQPGRMEWRVAESKIRYLALCYGVPLRILPDPYLKEEGMEKLRPEMRRNEAAVDSELTLLPLIEEKLPISGLLRNPVYGATNAALLHPTNGVLLVSRLDGPTPEIALGLVDKALQAEADGLWGRAYFDLRKITEPGFKQGDDWIRNAAEICRHLGFETVVDESPGTFPASFPMSQIAYYAGWYDQNISGPFTRSHVEFMPGAFAYHLHSFSAVTLRGTNQGWAGPLLGKGVTATMGCVNEPYLAGTPDVGVFTARFIYNGLSFGEAACASQPVLSWQTTVVGDPLYRPFGKNPDELHATLLRRQSKLIEWSFLRLVDLNQANGKSVSDLVTLLEDLGTTKESAVLTEKLGDLYAGLGKPNSAAFTYAKALKLNPSPMQRLRLRLELGAKLAELSQDTEAYEDFRELLTEFPDYPDKSGILKQLFTLSKKLKKDDEAEKIAAELKQLSESKP
jgi:uncharacterized protein (TIGR03790 family)